MISSSAKKRAYHQVFHDFRKQWNEFLSYENIEALSEKRSAIVADLDSCNIDNEDDYRQRAEQQHAYQASKAFIAHYRTPQGVEELKKLVPTKEWSGADVLITRDVSANPKSQPNVVETRHAGRLSRLFVQIRDVSSGLWNYMSKYGLFGGLAQAAIDIIVEYGDEDNSVLSFAVLEAFELWLEVDAKENIRFRLLYIALRDDFLKRQNSKLNIVFHSN